jgi:hypothetical protein
MRITNRDELHRQRSTGPGPVPVAPAADAPAPARADAAGPSAPRHRQHSGQRSRQARTERRRAARVASQRDAIADETATASTGGGAVSGPWLPLGLRGAAMAHTSSASTDVAAREGRPSRHAPAAGNLAATTDDESYHGSASELPPATSHGYAEWDFSGVPDPVTFQRFLKAADYWFGYSDNSISQSYDPARECFVVLANDQANAGNAAEAGDGEVPPTRELDHTRVRGRARLPPHHRGAPTLTRSWPKRASSKPNSWRSIARCAYFVPPSPGKPLRAASVRASWVSKLASASTPTLTSTTQARPRERAKNSSLPRHCCGPCPPLNARGAEPAPRGAGAHRASGRATGRELGVPHSPAGERAGRRGRASP